MQFLYVMDPMCAWCYGFEPELESFLLSIESPENNPSVTWVMGGLAPDNDVPMDDELKETIASYWHQIENKTSVTFNHDYWGNNTPYRSTYKACRAVIAAERLKPESSQNMVKAIQSAYYQQARNPSLNDTLIACGDAIGLNVAEFEREFKSQETEQKFQEQLGLVRHLQVGGFPALFFIDSQNRLYPLTHGYCQASHLAQRFNQIQSHAQS